MIDPARALCSASLSLSWEPPTPSPETPFVLRVVGVWCNGCTPKTIENEVLIVGKSIEVTVPGDPPPDGGCTSALTPFNVTALVPGLAAGVYDSRVELQSRRDGSTILTQAGPSVLVSHTTEIPTLGLYGLILMVIVLGVGGILRLRRAFGPERSQQLQKGYDKVPVARPTG